MGFLDYKRIIEQHKREIDQKDETNKKLNITIHDLTVSYEGQKKENANLKSIKWALEGEKAQLEKDKNDIKRQLVSLKTHWADLENQIRDLKQLLDRVQTFKACLGNLGRFYSEALKLIKFRQTKGRWHNPSYHKRHGTISFQHSLPRTSRSIWV